MYYLESILKAIGNTPLVKLNKLAPRDGPTILVKPEYLNPAGSIKDRMAHYVIAQAEKEGILKPGGTIVENTSGNTGAGVAMIAAIKGYKAIFTMPDKMSNEKIDLLRAFGARVVITPTDVPADSPQSYYETAKRIAKETPDSFYLNQYHNKNNIEAHYYTTGPEIYEQTEGKITHLIGGIGTGGTISGAGRYLKEKNTDIKVIAVDPEGSVFYDYFKTGKLVEAHAYKVEGIGENMITDAMDFSVVDDVIQVTDRECFITARNLARKEGIFAGGSSGGAVHAALKVAESAGPDDIIVVILPDSGMRYLSKIFNDQWMTDNGFPVDENMNGTVSDLLKNGIMKPIIVESKSTFRAAIDLMKKYVISQLPVKDNGKVSGMVYEIDLLRALTTRSCGPDDPVGNVAKKYIPQVSPDDSISTLAGMFTDSREAVLVMNGDKLKAILTRIDLISYLSRNRY